MTDRSSKADPPVASSGNGEQVDSLPAILRAIPDTIFRLSRDGTYLEASIPEGTILAAEPFGESGFIGKRVRDVLSPERARRCMEAIETACRTERPQGYQYCTAEGDEDLFAHPHTRWYDVRVVPLRAGAPGAEQVLCIVRNVTTERRAEAQARRDSGRMSLLLKQTAFGMIEWDLQLRIAEWNPGAQCLFARTREEMMGRPGLADIVAPTELHEARRVFDTVLRDRQGCNVQIPVRRPSGETLFVDWQLAPLIDDTDRVVGVTSIVHNVTERVRTEKMLQRERMLFMSGPVIGIRWLPLPGWPVDFVTQNISQFGYSPESFGREGHLFADLVHPEDLPLVIAEVRHYLDTGQPSFRQQYRFRTASGEYRWLDDTTLVVRDNAGNVQHLDGFLSDATQRVAAELELKRSREQYELLVNTIEGIVWEGDPESFRFTFMSRQAEWILGFPAERFVNEPDFWSSRLHPEDREWTKEYCQEQTRLKRDHQLEFRMIDADGSVVWLRDYVTVFEEGDATFVRGIIVDITKLKTAESALATSREQLERAQTVAHIGSWTWELKSGNKLTWSHETFRIFGVDESGFTGHVDYFSQTVFPDDLPSVRAASSAALEGGPRYNIDHRIVRADGAVRWVHQEADIVWDADGTPTQMIGVVQDITDRRAALEALRASEVRFRRVAESNLIGLFFWDSHGIISHANRVFLDMLGFGQSVSFPQRVAWRDLSPVECRSIDDDAVAELRRNGSCRPYAKELIRRDGSRIPVLVGMAFLDETRQQGVCFVLDITDRKHAERWQAFMMAELDHRVKNNMAAVLTLAEQTIRSGLAPAESGRILLGRLRALARTHGALANTHWQGARLLPLIQHALEAFSNADASNVQIDGDDLLLPPRVATVMSMAIHELATNALKYGALSIPAGRLRVAWRTAVVSESVRSLHIHWQESGGPRVAPPTRRGFGRELIEGGITHECEGTVRLEFHPEGVQCTIDLPLADSSQQPIIVKPSDLMPRRM